MRGGFANRWLAQLSEADLASLELEPAEYAAGEVIYEVDATLTHFIFTEKGLISITVTMQDGRSAGIAAVRGGAGVVGGSQLFLDNGHAHSTFTAQMPVVGWKCKREVMQAALKASPQLRAVFQRIAYIALRINGINAACNRLHRVEERCCRWLLTAHDSAGADVFPLTRDFLAQILGASQGKVSAALANLVRRGFIQRDRGQVRIIDRGGLERSVCECRAAVAGLG